MSLLSASLKIKDYIKWSYLVHVLTDWIPWSDHTAYPALSRRPKELQSYPAQKLCWLVLNLSCSYKGPLIILFLQFLLTCLTHTSVFLVCGLGGDPLTVLSHFPFSSPIILRLLYRLNMVTIAWTYKPLLFPLVVFVWIS